MTKIGVLLSGRGSNFRALANARIEGAEIVVAISNVASAGGLAVAQQLGIPAVHLSSKGLTREAYDKLLLQSLRQYDVKLVCLAGYMRLLSTEFIAAFQQRILNIHPSLLPSFPGLHAQAQAFEHGVKVAGCTVHFVDEGLDSGPIIMQRPVPVLDTDDEESLAARILEQEHELYPAAVRLVVSGAYQLAGRRVVAL